MKVSFGMRKERLSPLILNEEKIKKMVTSLESLVARWKEINCMTLNLNNYAQH